MEGLSRGENFEGKGFIADTRDSFDYEKIRELIKEKYCFNPSGKVSESPKDIGDLARMEKYFNRKKENMAWDSGRELKRCELKKNLEVEILNLNAQETMNFWLRVEYDFCNKFDEKGKKEEKDSSIPKKRQKRYTVLDFDENDSEKNGGWSREAQDSFRLLKSGIESEKIANQAFKNVLGAETRITNSNTDIGDKVDSIVLTDNAVLLVQIKTKLIALMEKSNTEIIQEINSDFPELEKKEFFKGWKRIKDEIEKNLGDNNKCKMLIKGVWLTIPTEWKNGKGSDCDERLEIRINEWCEKNGIKKAKD